VAFLLREPGDGPEEEVELESWCASGWQKWLPNRPTDPHWYAPERLRSLLGAYISKEREGGKPRTVREFISEFHGLKSPARQAAACKTAGLHGAYLHDLVVGNAVDQEAAERLLLAMQGESRAVRPRALGVLGERHLANCLEVFYDADGDS